MALSEFLKQLDELVTSATAAFDAAADEASLEAARIEFVGAKKGRLKAIQKLMGAVDSSERPAAGKRLNEVKAQIEAAFAAAQGRLGTLAGPRRAGPITPVRSDVAGPATAAGTPAPHHADHRRTQRHHGPTGFLGGGRTRDRRRVAQLRSLEHSAGTPGPRSAGQFLSVRRRRNRRPRCCCEARPAPCRFA